MSEIRSAAINGTFFIGDADAHELDGEFVGIVVLDDASISLLKDENDSDLLEDMNIDAADVLPVGLYVPANSHVIKKITLSQGKVNLIRL